MNRRAHALLAIQSAAAETDVEPVQPAPLSAKPTTSPATPELPRRPEETSRLREKLLGLQYRARDLFKSPWLRFSGTAPLILLADRGLGLIKRVQASLERRDSLMSIPEATNCDVSDSPALEGWMVETDAALAEIARQYSWMEITCRVADEVREFSVRLLGEQRVVYPDLLRLATLVFDSIAGIDSAEQLFPLPGLQMGSVYQGRQPCVRAAIFPQGVQSARYAAWAFVTRLGWRQDLPDLVLGALLQDIGWLALEPYVADASRRGPRRMQWLAQQHPQVGAAILAGISKVPLILPPMVALHHERLDGSGYPRRAAGSAISRTGRMLGCVARTFDLYQELSLDNRCGGVAEQVQRTADGMRHEAKYGWWDAASVSQLFAATPPRTAESDSPTESVDASPIVHSDRTIELHGEQTSPPASHTHGPAQQGIGAAARHGLHHSHLD